MPDDAVKPPIDRTVAIGIRLHRKEKADPALSIDKAGTNQTRIVRRPPKRKPPGK